jgi:hypothetical protein
MQTSSCSKGIMLALPLSLAMWAGLAVLAVDVLPHSVRHEIGEPVHRVLSFMHHHGLPHFRHGGGHVIVQA